jgi:stress-induced morphogen
MVNDVLAEELAGPVHALSITALGAGEADDSR